MAIEVRAVIAPYQFTRRELRQIWWAAIVGVLVLFTMVAGLVARHEDRAVEDVPSGASKPAP
jgi:hypothetical protein